MNLPFLHENFLLENPRAERIYHEFAAPLPIIDYHCHLSLADIAENRQFKNLTEIWLAGDHYKWRAMRTCGVPERCITGDASEREKFQRWAETVPKTLRNPLYHWTHMELRRPFGITGKLLSAETAEGIWNECNVLLASPEFSARSIMRQMNVEVVCTTDDPLDSLEHHRQLRKDSTFATAVLPTFRPDRAMAGEDPVAFAAYVRSAEKATASSIRTFQEYVDALRKRHTYFHAMGCRISDHGIEVIYAEPYSDAEVSSAFQQLLAGKCIEPALLNKFKSAMLYEFALMDHAREWVQQFHLGAMRNNNSRLMRVLGPDTGFDSIGDFSQARALGRFLDRLDDQDKLARTILYPLNPSDNEVFATMIGNFQDGSIPGKLQFGSAWWFLDQREGMVRQIEALSNMGLLSQFVGMLTDSRSFLSYPRHEYFRRLLCNILGTEMLSGLVPDDMQLVGSMVRDICHGNAQRYFRFSGPE